MIHLGGTVLRRCGNIPLSVFFRMGCFTSRLIGLQLLLLSTTGIFDGVNWHGLRFRDE
jgi:hypothetical protein